MTKIACLKCGKSGPAWDKVGALCGATRLYGQPCDGKMEVVFAESEAGDEDVKPEPSVIDATTLYRVYGRDYSTSADFEARIVSATFLGLSRYTGHVPSRVEFDNGVVIQGEIKFSGEPDQDGHAWFVLVADPKIRP